MVECPKCHHKFPESTASRGAFELFHALRDEYANENGYSKVEAKDILCVEFGISVEWGPDVDPPKWPGVFCRYLGNLYFRKSTLAYTKDEMEKLIGMTELAMHGEGV